MASDRSDQLYHQWIASTEKFDYFVVGLTGTLCAFISQTYTPEKVGLNPGTLELVALLILVAAVVSGIRRIENVLMIRSANHKIIYASEMRSDLAEAVKGGTNLINTMTGETFTLPEAHERVAKLTGELTLVETQIEQFKSQAKRWYDWRNRLILTGFLLLLLARVWSAYLPSASPA